MIQFSDIRFVKNTEIDNEKWDQCIQQSVNGIVYAYSWYLDIVCEGWNALIVGDYELVMPLPSARKYGVHYSLQPLFAQQFGVFSQTILTAEVISAFIKAIPSKYRLIKIHLNTFNPVVKNRIFTEGITYELDLIKSYDGLYKSFSNNTRRNIKKGKAGNIYTVSGGQPNVLVNLIKENVGTRLKFMGEEEYSRIRRIISQSVRYKLGQMYCAYDDTNNLVAGALFVETKGKVIYLFGSSNEAGIKKKAMFVLVDQFIHDFAENNLTLDFEGSKIEGLARFYAGFGARQCNFPVYSENRMPWPVKYLYKL